MTTLYSFLPRIELTMGSAGTTQNTPMNERKITLHKGLLNQFDVKVYDQNRRPVNLAQKQVFWRLIQHRMGAIATGPCTVQLAKTGHFLVQLNDRDIGEMTNGKYHMSFAITDVEGNETPLYSNMAAQCEIVVEIKEGSFMTTTKSQETRSFFIAADGWHYSDSFQPRSGTTGVHTVSCRMFGFTGQFKAEYSMDVGLAGATWKPVPIEGIETEASYVNATQTAGFVFELEYATWVRFAWKPATTRINEYGFPTPNYVDSGEVDKVIYRN